MRFLGRDSDVDDRALPPEEFAALHRRFHFSVDAAASSLNAKLPLYWDVDQNGLVQPWAGERVYCNPPYSDILPWVQKAMVELRANAIVLLLPANRTEQGWWQGLVEPYRDGRHKDGPRTEFLRGRTRFIKRGKAFVGPNERPPFGCVLLIWDHRRA